MTKKRNSITWDIRFSFRVFLNAAKYSDRLPCEEIKGCTVTQHIHTFYLCGKYFYPKHFENPESASP